MTQLKKFPYEIIEEYVRGGCSVIYKVKALDREGPESRQYVLKTMDLSEDEAQDRKQFYMEYEFLRAYPHPNLVEVKEYFPDWHGRPAYIMEWVRGNTWQSYWREKNVFDHLMTFLVHFKQLCEVLDYIHKHQIIHRDLKPQNILLTRDDVVKLIDFGIMKVADLSMYRTSNIMGTAYYVAPECLSGKTITKAVDIYALGVMLYDLFTGMKPFQGQSMSETIYQRLSKAPQPPSAIAEVPESLDPILLKMLAIDPYKRYRSCGEVFAELENLFGKFKPQPKTLDKPNIDVLTKGLLLHGPFLDNCEALLEERSVLYLVGDEGAGKTTLSENLCARMFGDAVVRVSCRAHNDELELMELVLQNLDISSSSEKELTQWREILGSALPGLHWAKPAIHQPLDQSMIVSAFKHLFMATRRPLAVLIEDLHEAKESMVRFVQELAGWISGKSGSHCLILTASGMGPKVGVFGLPVKVEFPDVVTLSEYLSDQFGGCQIPLELTQSLVAVSGKNTGQFINIVQKYRTRGRLSILDGVLRLFEGDPESDSGDLAEAVPSELKQFSQGQLRILEWIALCPDGLNMNILKLLTKTDIDDLGKIIGSARELSLLEYRSGFTEGFGWKNKKAQQVLLRNINLDEKLARYLVLAEAIENETKPYLPYSPPLWVLLCRLYQQAQDDLKASEYAMKYARYCFQNANYGPIRDFLSPFIPFPEFQNNGEFWVMLALANASGDIPQALYFADKALRIQENSEVLALLAILEFMAHDEEKAKTHLEKLFARKDYTGLEVQFVTKLLPVLLDLGERNKAEALHQSLKRNLAGRGDLFAINALILANIQVIANDPPRVIREIGTLNQELLPQTRRELDRYLGLAYQDLFEYEKARAAYDREADERSDSHFQNLLFLNLDFEKINEVKRLISEFDDSLEKQPRFKVFAPLVQLVTQVLVQDPQAFQLGYILSKLDSAGVGRSSWLALLASILDWRMIDAELLQGVLDSLGQAAEPWARLRIPRLSLMTAVKLEQVPNLGNRFEALRAEVESRGLLMEQLRLYRMQIVLRDEGLRFSPVSFNLDKTFLEDPETLRFLKPRK